MSLILKKKSCGGGGEGGATTKIHPLNRDQVNGRNARTILNGPNHTERADKCNVLRGLLEKVDPTFS